MTPENYAEFPTSLAERRGLEDCQRWAPRDVLIHMLRQIDSGEWVPDGIVICWVRHEDDDHTATGLRRSKCTVLEAVGMIEAAKHDLLSVP